MAPSATCISFALWHQVGKRMSHGMETAQIYLMCNQSFISENNVLLRSSYEKKYLLEAKFEL